MPGGRRPVPGGAGRAGRPILVAARDRGFGGRRLTQLARPRMTWWRQRWRSQMTTEARSHADRFQELYDVERHVMATDGGILVEDPYPAWAELRAAAPVHKGTVRQLMGYDTPGGLGGRHHRPVYAAFSWEANDTAFRDNDVFSSTFYEGLTTQGMGRGIL